MIRRTLAAIVAVVALRADAAPLRPVPWLDPSALAKPFLQLAFEAPETVQPGELDVSIRTFYSSTIFDDWSATLRVNVQVETAQPTAVVRYGIARGTELQLLVPGAIDYAGWLSRPIKVVEALFSSVNPLRAGPPPRQGRIQLTRPDGTGVDWVGEDGSVGDLTLGVKRVVRRQAGIRPALALRALVGLPTGRFPGGTGQASLAAGLTAGWADASTAFWAEVDAAMPGPTFSAMHLPTRPHGALQLGVARRLASAVSLHLQASRHGAALAPTGVDVIDGPVYYLLAGVTVEPLRAVSLAFALVENVLTNSRGADITGVLEVRWRR